MSNFPANLPLDGLLDLACRDGVDIRPTLLRVLTDLYVQKPAHSAQEEAQYVELAQGLIDAVDAPTRDAVTARLSGYASAPPAILSRLAQVAGRNAAGAPAMARPNPSAEAELVEAFFAASAQERRLILTNLDGTDTAPRRPLPASSEVVRRLENAALSRNPGEFGRILERALGIGRALADRVTRDHSGEPIVVAARALGMKADVLQRILLFLNPTVGLSVERVYDLVNLYEDVTPAAAQRMTAIWRAAAGCDKQPVYEGAIFDDEKRGVRHTATDVQRRPMAQPGRIIINRR